MQNHNLLPINMEVFDWQQRDGSTPFSVHLLAGSLAGLVEHLSMLPLDNVKTHCQAGSTLRFKEIVAMIYRNGGIANFYSGSCVLIMGCAPAHAIYFSIYEQAKVFLNCPADPSNSRFALVGAISSLFHDLIMTPTETIKQRLQLFRSQTGLVTSSKLIGDMYNNQGMRGFYRSFAVNYSMNVPFGSMLVLLNEKVKHLLDIRESSNSSYWWYYLIGGLSGGVASIPTCPFDVLKTKLNTQTCLNHQCEKKTFCMELARYQKVCRNVQTKPHKDNVKEHHDNVQGYHDTVNNKIKGYNQNLNAFKDKNVGKLLSPSKQLISNLKPTTLKYRNVFNAAEIIWRQQGILGFFSGLKVRMAIQSLSSAMAWGTYQIAKGTLSPAPRF